LGEDDFEAVLFELVNDIPLGAACFDRGAGLRHDSLPSASLRSIFAAAITFAEYTTLAAAFLAGL
jgi:hypothetical protein